MECNKDEATRAKSIAEAKIEQKDYIGAKKFASKAQSLYPGLDGITQMLTTLDVYVSAENKISGEVDWYSVLSVNPSADVETIKKQYRKLALMLHPDKNKSIGADGAFKLISAAWSFLSDKAKRLEYNKRRGYKGGQQNVRTHMGGPSAPPRPSQQKFPTHTGCPSAPSRPSQQKVPTDARGSSAPSRPSQQKVPSRSSNCASRKTSASKRQSRSAKAPSKPTPAPSQQRTDTFWTTCYQCNTQYEYLKIYLNCPLLCRHCQKPFMASETDPPAKFVKSAKPLRRNSVNNVAAGQSSFRYGNNQQGPIFETADTGIKEPSIASKVADDVQKMQDQQKRSRVESFGRAGWEGFLKKSKLGNDKEKCTTKESDEEKYGCNSCADNVKEHPEAIDVPGSEFHNFDVDRCESSFADNEIWAAYDNDGMPRSYALITKVVSRDPFELMISWLNSESSHIDWAGPSLYRTCGEFRVGEYGTCTSVNTFSHRVNWSKINHGGIIIFPQKGEFWALYNDEAVHKFDMVVVLDNYDEEGGVSVAPLVKVAGFRTIFLPNLDPAAIQRITKEEISRFSHRVPHYILSREEAPNAPKGSVELDPAATPLELLQIVTETGGV
ncbi:hypothetical protein ACS0TY_010405 [Phlomoides rotata]